MKSNNLDESVNVIWQLYEVFNLPLELPALFLPGVLAVSMMRRYKTSLAIARTQVREHPVRLVEPTAMPAQATAHATTTTRGAIAHQDLSTQSNPAPAVA